MFTAAPIGRAPFTGGRVRPPLPTPMDDGDNITRSSNTTPACVSGGRAPGGGGGSRPFTRPSDGAVDYFPSSSKATLSTPPAAIAADQGKGPAAVSKPSRKGQRGVPLMQWVWPANSGSAIARVGSEWFRGAKVAQQENPARLQGRTQKSSVVVGTVCEPVRPTRLDLSAAQGEKGLRRSAQIGGLLPIRSLRLKNRSVDDGLGAPTFVLLLDRLTH